MWERRPTEDDDAWNSFSAYLGMHPAERRMARAGTYSNLRKTVWFRGHNWRERCEAYDAHLAEIVRVEREDLLRREVKDLAREHNSMIASMRDLYTSEMAKWAETSRLSDVPGMGGTKLKDIIKIGEVAIKLQRLSNGETTENVGTGLDLGKLSEEEAEALFALMQKASGPDTEQ